MKLSDKEARILACVELQADLSIEQIRKQTKLRDHTIRYCLKSLKDRKIITLVPFINLHALGYTYHNVYFSVVSENKKQRSAFLSELLSMKPVVWVAEMGAEFEYGIGIATQHLSEVRSTLNYLSQKFGNIFYHKSISSQFSVTLLPRGYFAENKTRIKPLGMNRGERKVEIDKLDDAILAAISKTPELSHRAIAQNMNVPLSTFELRVKKLRDNGILLGYFYSIDASKFAAECFIILIYGKGISPSLTQRLLAFSAKHPNVTSFIEAFGSWDYEITIEVTRPRQAVTITQEIYEEFGDELNTVKVLSKFKDLKESLYPA